MFDFGLQLKELRTQRGLTQKALAVRIKEPLNKLPLFRGSLNF